jgi:formiminotetrahydrofolate cyclodeaminase
VGSHAILPQDFVPPPPNQARVEALDEYLTKLASAEPVPGGGSAAMVVGATACALVAMVARIGDAEDLAGRADRLCSDFLQGKARDEAAYSAVVAARGNRDAVQRALVEAAAAPLDGAAASLRCMHLVLEALELRKKHLISDVGCAGEFAHAALRACAYNVRINHAYLKDAELVGAQETQLQRYEVESEAMLSVIRRALR